MNFLTRYSVRNALITLNVVFARKLAKLNLTVNIIYLHLLFVNFIIEFLRIVLCFFMSGLDRSNCVKLPAIITPAVSGIASKLPPKNKPVRHNKMPQYSRPDMVAIIIFCLLMIVYAHFPDKKAAINSITMIQYPA